VLWDAFVIIGFIDFSYSSDSLLIFAEEICIWSIWNPCRWKLCGENQLFIQGTLLDPWTSWSKKKKDVKNISFDMYSSYFRDNYKLQICPFSS